MHRRVLHDERRVVGKADQFQLAVVDRQALRRRERLVVAGSVPDVGVPGQHPVVVVRVLLGDDVVHRILVAQRLVHRPRVGPGVSRRELKPGGRAVRQSGGHVLWVRHNRIPCQQGTANCHQMAAPGFRMFSGSSAALMRRLSSIASGPIWSANHGLFSLPTPCSPVMVPPSPIARSMISPNAR